MQFVALDLETTWLNPKEDSIIEVAAIRFLVSKNEDGIFVATDIEERSMLIDPGVPLSEEVTMITGISEKMLAWKETWDTVKVRVSEFIGDAIIVGHNVFFDIEVLKYHGVSLEKNLVLDTFELSEIFSQEAESLNLGFLGNLYGISAWDKEHRALGDTRLSVWLFIHYINTLKNLPPEKKNILNIAKQKESEKNISLLLEVSGEMSVWEIDFVFPTGYTLWNKKYEKSYLWKTGEIKTYFLSNFPDEENGIIGKLVHTWQTIDIFVPSKKVGKKLENILQMSNIDATFVYDISEFLSLDALRESYEKASWNRKESILLTKILFWLSTTKTGLIDELKFYGSEREEIGFFQAKKGENILLRLSEDTHKIHIYTSYSALQDTSILRWDSLMIKDVSLLSDIAQKVWTTHISFAEIYSLLWTENSELVESIELIEWLYLSFPKRPSGPNSTPPGDYGETYLFSQEDIWHTGNKWLSLATKSLSKNFETWKKSQKETTRREKHIRQRLEKFIQELIHFHSLKEKKSSILTIKDDSLSLVLIPNDTRERIINFFENQKKKDITLYSPWVAGPIMTKFLENEYGIGKISEPEIKVWDKNIIIDEYVISKVGGGTVILTTSMKHAREIGKELQKSKPTVLIQWISWGKGKMQSLFVKNRDSAILVGTIENWRDEYTLWAHAKQVVIAKMPFDPPTDAYFLAKTVGMKNNFELYSTPLVITKLNTIVERIRSTGNMCPIFCSDNRLTVTEWGRMIAKELL